MIPDLPLVDWYTCTHCDRPVAIRRDFDGAWGVCEGCGRRFEVVMPAPPVVGDDEAAWS